MIDMPLTPCFNSDISIGISASLLRHVDCAKKAPLVKVWVILDRPPNDPLLRKKESFTSSNKAGRCNRPECSSHMIDDRREMNDKLFLTIRPTRRA